MTSSTPQLATKMLLSTVKLVTTPLLPPTVKTALPVVLVKTPLRLESAMTPSSQVLATTPLLLEVEMTSLMLVPTRTKSSCQLAPAKTPFLVEKATTQSPMTQQVISHSKIKSQATMELTL
jgi:hypothetical protein